MQKAQELELQTREASVQKLKGQLFQLKTNKEYTAMQHEIDTLKADNSLLEDAILKTFESIDQAKQHREREGQARASAQQQVEQERQRWRH